MKAAQRKRRIPGRLAPLAVKRLAVRPGEILIVKMPPEATEADLAGMSEFLRAVMPSVGFCVTKQEIALAVIAGPPAPLEIRGVELPPDIGEQIDEAVRRGGMRAGEKLLQELDAAPDARGFDGLRAYLAGGLQGGLTAAPSGPRRAIQEGIQNAGLGAGGERPEGRGE